VVAARDLLIVLEQHIDALVNRGAVVLLARAGDPRELFIVDDAPAQHAHGLALPYRRGREQAQALDARRPHDEPRIEPASLRNSLAPSLRTRH
jgi:hypothetical protein